MTTKVSYCKNTTYLVLCFVLSLPWLFYKTLLTEIKYLFIAILQYCVPKCLVWIGPKVDVCQENNIQNITWIPCKILFLLWLLWQRTEWEQREEFSKGLKVDNFHRYNLHTIRPLRRKARRRWTFWCICVGTDILLKLFWKSKNFKIILKLLLLS